MIRSMTGFGRCEKETGDYKISVEIKAVNHRYLDVSIKMPKRFNCFESAIRSLLKQDLQRGKVDVFISCEQYGEQAGRLTYNAALAAEYAAYCMQMAEQLYIPDDLKTTSLARMPEVLVMEEAPEDEERLWELLSQTIKEAVGKLAESRSREGEALKRDLLEKLSGMEALVAYIEERSPQILSEYRKRLEDKVKELLEGAAIDESRIAAETAIYADRICVDEELVRLKSHIAATRRELEAGGSVGRKLDFIAQELNREANTILSKSTDLAVSDRAIALKTEIEKVREQIQNIE